MRILRPINRKYRTGSEKGFTLIELMLVLSIIAAVVVLAGRRMYKGKETPNSIIRKLSVLSRQLHTQAKLDGVIYRLVLARQIQEDQEVHAFWAERASSNTLYLINPEREQAEKDDNEDEKQNQPGSFSLAKRLTKEPITLPPSIRYKWVETEGYNEPVVEGTAYIHFFPQGLIEESVIQFENERGLEWSVAIHPLTGKLDLVKEHIRLDELQGN